MYKNVTAEVQDLTNIIRHADIEERKAQITEFRCIQTQNQIMLHQKEEEKIRQMKQLNENVKRNSQMTRQMIEEKQKKEMSKKMEIKTQFQQQQQQKNNDEIERKKDIYAQFLDQSADLQYKKQLISEANSLKAKEKRLRLKEQEKIVKQQNLVSKIHKKIEFQDYQNNQLEYLAIRAKKAQMIAEKSKQRQIESISQMKSMKFKLELEALSKK